MFVFFFEFLAVLLVGAVFLVLKEKAFGWLLFPAYAIRCVPLHPSCSSLDTFPHLGEGFYGCAIFKKLGRSI